MLLVFFIAAIMLLVYAIPSQFVFADGDDSSTSGGTVADATPSSNPPADPVSGPGSDPGNNTPAGGIVQSVVSLTGFAEIVGGPALIDPGDIKIPGIGDFGSGVATGSGDTGGSASDGLGNDEPKDVAAGGGGGQSGAGDGDQSNAGDSVQTGLSDNGQSGSDDSGQGGLAADDPAGSGNGGDEGLDPAGGAPAILGGEEGSVNDDSASSGFTVTYRIVNGTWADGSAGDKTETVAEGGSLADIPDGMNADADYNQKPGSWDNDPNDFGAVEGDVTFTFSYETLNTYTVNYVVDGQPFGDTQTYTAGDEFSPVGLPVAPEGKTYLGWHKSADCDDYAYWAWDKIVINSDITFYAMAGDFMAPMALDGELGPYTVTFDPNIYCSSYSGSPVVYIDVMPGTTVGDLIDRFQNDPNYNAFTTGRQPSGSDQVGSGFEFIGWSPARDTQITEDMTITALWNGYIIDYKDNSKNEGILTFSNGPYTLIIDTTKSGGDIIYYSQITSEGENATSTTTGKTGTGSISINVGSVSFTIDFKGNSLESIGNALQTRFAVTYDANGHGKFDNGYGRIDLPGLIPGSGTPYYNNGDGPAITADPGWKFDGWDQSISQYVNGNVTYKAKWVIDDSQKYTITYEAGAGGSVDPASESHQVLFTGLNTGSTATADRGYKFVNWTSDSAGLDEVSTDAEYIPGTLGDATYYANFEIDPDQTYTINYVANTGGSVAPASETHQVLFAGPNTGSTATADRGYKFVNWTSDSAGLDEVSTDAEYIPDTLGDATYYANFEIDPDQTYTINYVANTGGSVAPTSETRQVLFAGPNTGSTAAADPGYTFVNWTDANDNVVSTTENYIPGTNVAATYTAHFAARTDLTYVVNYYLAETATPLAPARTVTGQTMATMVTENAIAISGYTVVPPASRSLLIKADGNVINFYYNTITYNISYELDGGVNAADNPATYTVRSAFPIKISDPARNGYTFNGWTAAYANGVADGPALGYSIPAGTTGNITLTAQWTQNTSAPAPAPTRHSSGTTHYTVTYVPGAYGTFGSQTYGGLTYGSATPRFVGTARGAAGYVFGGWSPSVAGTVTGNVTYTARWVLAAPVTEVAPLVVVPPEQTPQVEPAPVPEPVPAPTPEPPVTIEPTTPPLANIAAWALLNLILTIVTVIIMLLLLITYFVKKKDDREDEYDYDQESEQKVRKHLVFRLLTIATTVVAIILFIMTEDMSLPMGLYDNWTIWHVVITAVTVLLAILSRKKYEKNDYKEYEI